MRVALPIAMILLLAVPGRAADCSDATALGAARDEVATTCDCAGAASHGTYVRCAAGIVRTRYLAGTLPRECMRSALRCARRSTCGRPGTVTCCRPRHDGVRCTVGSPDRCTAAGGCIGAFESCCDSCDGAGCVPTSTTSTSTSTTSSTSTTVPTCGNGIVEAGEQCDSPLPFCTPSCQGVFTMCCSTGPFCGQTLSTSGCYSVGGHLYFGRGCVGSSCVGQAMPPTTVCCPLAGSCVDATVTSSEELGSFIFDCFMSGGPDTGQVPSGSCGVDGTCVAP